MCCRRGKRAVALTDGEIGLRLVQEGPADAECGSTGSLCFEILPAGRLRAVGYVSLRFGESPELYYLGHVGYRVDEPSRGHGYAGKAVRLVLPLARERGFHSLVITTDPDNAASRITCERLGCVLERTVPVPERFRALCMGSVAKCRYILRLDGDGAAR